MAQKIIALNNNKTHYELGKAAFEKKNYLKAFKYFLKITKDDPYNFEAHSYLATIFEIYGDLEHSSQEYEILVKLKPNDPQLSSILLDIYLRLENYDAALKIIKKILKMDPDNEENWYKLTDILYFTKRYQEALKVLNKLIKQHSEDEELFFKIFMVYRELNDYSNALSYGLKLLKINQTSPVYLYFLGTVYEKLQDLGEAQNCYNKALDLLEKNAEEKSIVSDLYHAIYEKIRILYSTG